MDAKIRSGTADRTGRRGFLGRGLAMASGAVAAAVAYRLPATKATAETIGPTEGPAAATGYRETALVRKYYATARD